MGGTRMRTDGGEWPRDCHTGLEEAIAEFRAALPGWWYSIGECQVSCDASAAPTGLSPDIGLTPVDDRFNAGFHADLLQPSTLAEALRMVTRDALEAKRICETDEERKRGRLAADGDRQ